MAYTFPLCPVGAIFHVRVRYGYANQTLRNGYHVRVTGNSNNRNVDTVANAINTEFAKADGIFDKQDAIRDAGCVHVDTAVQMISPQRYVALGYARAVDGDVVSLGMDITQITAVLTRRAVIATRRGVSALHLPIACEEGVIDAGVLSATTLTRLSEIGNLILGLGNLGDGITVEPIIYHRGAVPEYHRVESFIGQPQVRIVRRRTVGLGE